MVKREKINDQRALCGENLKSDKVVLFTFFQDFLNQSLKLRELLMDGIPDDPGALAHRVVWFS